MTNLSNADRVASGTLGLTVRYELIGEVEDTLARNGATIELAIHQGLAELLDMAVLGAPFFYFEMEFERETLSFNLTSDRYRPGDDIEIAISLVEEWPYWVKISDLPEAARDLLSQVSDTDTSDPNKSG
jgi:hypothetical protein